MIVVEARNTRLRKLVVVRRKKKEKTNKNLDSKKRKKVHTLTEKSQQATKNNNNTENFLNFSFSLYFKRKRKSGVCFLFGNNIFIFSLSFFAFKKRQKCDKLFPPFFSKKNKSLLSL
jgi:hypothetical protein